MNLLHTNFLKTKWSLNLFVSCLETTDDTRNKNIKESIYELYPQKKLQKTPKYKLSKLQEELENLRNQLTLVERINLLTELYQIRVPNNLIEQHRLVYIIFSKENQEFYNNMQLLLSIPGVGPDTAAL